MAIQYIGMHNSRGSRMYGPRTIYFISHANNDCIRVLCRNVIKSARVFAETKQQNATNYINKIGFCCVCAMVGVEFT